MPAASPEKLNQDEGDDHPAPAQNVKSNPLLSIIKSLIPVAPVSENGLREVLEDYMDKPNITLDSVSLHEQALLSNILKLRDISVDEVMVPRADIISVEVNANRKELLDILSKHQFSRFPVYEGSLDEVLGTVHLKDMVGSLAQGKELDLKNIVTDVPIVSPFMPILDLLVTMRDSRRHIALVVDEFGGIDGLVSIGDVIEAIVGEIEDEHDTEEPIQIMENHDGSLLVDARMDIEEFENHYGEMFTHSEREESDTLGGLVSMLAGRVPVRGEVLTHDSGIVFEILDADRRRVKRIRVCNIPPSNAHNGAAQ